MINVNIIIEATGVTAVFSMKLRSSKLYPISGRQEEKNVL